MEKGETVVNANIELIPICSLCGDEVLSTAVKAEGKRYHLICWVMMNNLNAVFGKFGRASALGEKE